MTPWQRRLLFFVALLALWQVLCALRVWPPFLFPAPGDVWPSFLGHARSGALAGWQARGELTIERKQAEVKNVVGVLEGAGALADETATLQRIDSFVASTREAVLGAMCEL